MMEKCKKSEEISKFQHEKDKEAKLQNGDKGPTSSKLEGKAEWFTLGVVVCINVLLGINFVAFSVLYVYFVEYFQSNKAICGWIGSIQIGITQTFGLFVSPVLMMFGCRPVSFTGSVLVTSAMCISAFAPSLLGLILSFGFVAGLGLGMMYITNAVVIQERFHKNRALAGGIAMSGLSVGSAIGSVLTELFEEVYGWRGALLMHAALMAHAIILSILLHPPWVPYRYWHKERKSNQKVFTTFISHFCDFSLCKDIPFMLFCFAYFLLMINSNSFWNHLHGRAVFNGVANSKGAILLSLLAVGILFSRIVFSFVANLQCVNTVLLFSVGMLYGGLSSYLLAFTYTFPWMAVVALLFGSHIGCSVTVISVSAVSLVGAENIARAQGFINFSYGLAALTATPFSGWIFDLTNNYNTPFYVTGSMAVLGASMSLVSFLTTTKLGCCKKAPTYIECEVKHIDEKAKDCV